MGTLASRAVRKVSPDGPLGEGVGLKWKRVLPQVQVRTEKGEAWEGTGPWVGGGEGSWVLGKGMAGVRVFGLEPRVLWMEEQPRTEVPERLGRLRDTAGDDGDTVGMEQTPKASLQSPGATRVDHQGGAGHGELSHGPKAVPAACSGGGQCPGCF